MDVDLILALLDDAIGPPLCLASPIALAYAAYAAIAFTSRLRRPRPSPALEASPRLRRSARLAVVAPAAIVLLLTYSFVGPMPLVWWLHVKLAIFGLLGAACVAVIWNENNRYLAERRGFDSLRRELLAAQLLLPATLVLTMGTAVTVLATTPRTLVDSLAVDATSYSLLGSTGDLDDRFNAYLVLYECDATTAGCRAVCQFYVPNTGSANGALRYDEPAGEVVAVAAGAFKGQEQTCRRRVPGSGVP